MSEYIIRWYIICRFLAEVAFPLQINLYVQVCTSVPLAIPLLPRVARLQQLILLLMKKITIFSQQFHNILLVHGAQRIRANSETQRGKLLGPIPVCED